MRSPRSLEPLRLGNRTGEHIDGHDWPPQRVEFRRNPWVWLFASGVLLKSEWLTREQLERFTRPGAPNLWEPEEEAVITAALLRAGAACIGCVFLDIGALRYPR